MAQSNQADLGRYGKTLKLLKEENIDPQGQMNYNAGVIFFSMTPETQQLFEKWEDLAKQHQRQTNSDQALLNIAMNHLAISPYALTTAFNYRGYLWIRTNIRIWHHRNPPPKNLNRYPGKMRSVMMGRIIYPLPDRPDLLGFIINKLNKLRHRIIESRRRN